MRHFEDSVVIPASPQAVFDFIDDHKTLSGHMNKSSWMMGGGSFTTTLDAGQGRSIGSHIRMSGRVFGLNLYLDEVVTRRDPPSKKSWQTVGTPQLLVIGQYEMIATISPHATGSLLKVEINYELPPKNRWLGQLFSGIYARWCVKQMIRDTITALR